jgi:hypothetical protein
MASIRPSLHVMTPISAAAMHAQYSIASMCGILRTVAFINSALRQSLLTPIISSYQLVVTLALQSRGAGVAVFGYFSD